MNALARRRGDDCACREPARLRPRVKPVAATRSWKPSYKNGPRWYYGWQRFADRDDAARWARAEAVRFPHASSFGADPSDEPVNVNSDGSPLNKRRAVREVSERVASRRPRDVEPIILAGSPGAKCRPFLTVHKDDGKFAACNALADEIGPLNDPKKVFRLLEEAIGDELNEVFGVMTLDLHGRLKGMTETGRGEASSVMAPMLPTIRAALLSGGGGAILFHCHPSGIEAAPSKADKDTTKAFDEAFGTVGMPLIDHIVIAGDRRRRSYFSFAEAGLL